MNRRLLIKKLVAQRDELDNIIEVLQLKETIDIHVEYLKEGSPKFEQVEKAQEILRNARAKLARLNPPTVVRSNVTKTLSNFDLRK